MNTYTCVGGPLDGQYRSLNDAELRNGRFVYFVFSGEFNMHGQPMIADCSYRIDADRRLIYEGLRPSHARR